MNQRVLVVSSALASAVGVTSVQADTLVFDDNTIHQLAQTAAANVDPGGTVVANSGNFNALLISQAWDVVVVDAPSDIPNGGWGPLITFINGGGRAVMSFWDWDNDSSFGDPNLPPAFGVSVSSSIFLAGATLFANRPSCVFAGVTMPNADWHDHWSDDGDQFNLLPGSVGLGHIGTPATPVVALGNGGRTIAAPAFDEAGDTWLGDGSAVQLWENMITTVMGPDADNDGVPDNCDVCPGGDDTVDCDHDGIPDDCAIADGLSYDCNCDGVPDECEIANDPSLDLDNSGFLDSCESCPDINCDGVVWVSDLWQVIINFGETGVNKADVNFDGVVNFIDYLIVASHQYQFCGGGGGGWWW